MTPKKKAAGVRSRAAFKTTCEPNHTPTASRVKALIAGAACWGAIPIALADWLIQHGGMRDA